MHHSCELIGWELQVVSKINDIARKASWINLGSVNINDSDILGVLLGPGANGNRWQK